MVFFPMGLKNKFETAVEYEPSVFEPLKFYCTYKYKAQSISIPQILISYNTLLYFHLYFNFCYLKLPISQSKFSGNQKIYFEISVVWNELQLWNIRSWLHTKYVILIKAAKTSKTTTASKTAQRTPTPASTHTKPSEMSKTTHHSRCSVAQGSTSYQTCDDNRKIIMIQSSTVMCWSIGTPKSNKFSTCS